MVAAAYLGLLVREWEPAMPPALIPSRFLGLLYVLHDRADELGHVRPRHGADVVQDLVRVACLNTEDTVRHLDAAVAVGFVVVQRGPLRLRPPPGRRRHLPPRGHPTRDRGKAGLRACTGTLDGSRACVGRSHRFHRCTYPLVSGPGAGLMAGPSSIIPPFPVLSGTADGGDYSSRPSLSPSGLGGCRNVRIAAA